MPLDPLPESDLSMLQRRKQNLPRRKWLILEKDYVISRTYVKGNLGSVHENGS